MLWHMLHHLVRIRYLTENNANFSQKQNRTGKPQNRTGETDVPERLSIDAHLF